MFLRYQRIKLTCSLLLHYYRCLLLHLTSSLWKIDHLAVVAFRCSYSSEHSTELVRRGRGATSKLLGNSKLGNVQGLGSGPDKKNGIVVTNFKGKCVEVCVPTKANLVS